jgi:hypothetical protein
VKGRLDLHYERLNFDGFVTYFTLCTVETPFTAKWRKR